MKLVQACQALVQLHQNVLEVANYLIFLVNFCAGTTKAVVESIQLCGFHTMEWILSSYHFVSKREAILNT